MIEYNPTTKYVSYYHYTFFHSSTHKLVNLELMVLSPYPRISPELFQDFLEKHDPLIQKRYSDYQSIFDEHPLLHIELDEDLTLTQDGWRNIIIKGEEEDW